MEPTQTGSPSAGQGNGAQAGGGIIGKARERATAQLTEQKNKAVDGIGSVTQAVRQSTQQLRDQQHDTLAQYVERAASEVDRFAQQLRNKDVGDLLADAQRLARRQPAVFIGAAFMLGLIGARFLKSSARNHESDEGQFQWHGSSTRPVPYSGTAPGVTTPDATQRTSAGEFGRPTGSTDVSDTTGATSASGTPSSLAGGSSRRSGSRESTGGTSTPRTRRSTESGRD